MIEALRITLNGNIPYERVKVYSHFLGDNMSAPNFFEDSQLVFTCKNGKFMVPDYSVILVQVHKQRKRAPDGSVNVKRILLTEDLNYQNCHVIHQKDYTRLGIPQVFREYEQMSFVCNDGLFITTDFHVRCIQLYE